jgi:hypothetical protein
MNATDIKGMPRPVGQLQNKYKATESVADGEIAPWRFPTALRSSLAWL